MDPDQAVDDAQDKFAQALERFRDNLKSLRTGRASAAMLDGIMVEAYGVATPINQVATVSAPEAQLLQITPFDPNNLEAISVAIRDNQSLGLNPSDDGRIIRIPVPALTEERRRDLAKQISTKQEDCMISLRSIRHDALDAIKADKKLGEDEAKRLTTQVDNDMAKVKTDAEAAAKAKEQELLTI